MPLSEPVLIKSKLCTIFKNHKINSHNISIKMDYYSQEHCSCYFIFLNQSCFIRGYFCDEDSTRYLIRHPSGHHYVLLFTEYHEPYMRKISRDMNRPGLHVFNLEDYDSPCHLLFSNNVVYLKQQAITCDVYLFPNPPTEDSFYDYP